MTTCLHCEANPQDLNDGLCAECRTVIVAADKAEQAAAMCPGAWTSPRRAQLAQVARDTREAVNARDARKARRAARKLRQANV